MAKDKKRGRFGNDEIKFVRENHTKMTVEQMADKLNREPDTVRSLTYKLGLSKNDDGEIMYDMEFEIQNKPYYKNIEKQFDEAELELFKYHWIKIIRQFNNDVLPTEELQIVDTIKMELMMNRCLDKQRRSLDEVNVLRSELSEMAELDTLGTAEKQRIAAITAKIAALNAADDAAGNQYRSLQKEKNSLFEKIKGVRSERVRQIENNRVTFGSLLAKLIADTEFRRQCGERMEMRRLAAIDEEVRLSAYHKYEDGELDQVLLTPDSVKEGNQS